MISLKRPSKLNVKGLKVYSGPTPRYNRVSGYVLSSFALLFGGIGLYTLMDTKAAEPALACTTTISTGANVASTISNATAGSVICLNNGSYGNIDVTNVVKSSMVTVQSVNDKGATAYFNISKSNQLSFRNMTLTGMGIDTNQQGGSKNISFLNNKFTGQAVVNVGNNGNANILIDGNSFDNISICSQCYEGRLQIIANPWTGLMAGVTISNNHFGGPGESDGIQIAAKGVVVGPGNVFDGIDQLPSYSAHVDALQGYGQEATTIIGNYFLNGDTYLMMPDGGENEIIKDNVFMGDGNYMPKIQLGSHHGTAFTHNTVTNSNVHMDRKTENTGNPSTNGLIRDNIFINGGIGGYSTNTSYCSNCTFTRNLFNSAGNASGTNNIIGMPTFAGGSTPVDWAGFALAAASIGKSAATDGADMGTTYYGSGSVPLPPQNPSDTTAPTVSLTAPANGATVSGSSVTLSANASDNVGIVGVRFRVDGSNVGSEDTNSPYSITWNSTSIANGSHTITAVARDAAGNTTTSSGRTINVNNTTASSPATAMNKPLYRLYDHSTYRHFWTSDPAERDFVVSVLKFKYEGVASYVSNSPGTGLTPLYRLYDHSTYRHFWTSDPAERDFVVSVLKFKYEGIASYISNSPGTGLTPLYRLYDHSTYRHFWTSDPAERDFVVSVLKFKYEGVASYVKSGQ